MKDKKVLVSYRQLAKALDVPWTTFVQWSDQFFNTENTIKGKAITIDKSSPETLTKMFVIKQLRGFWRCPISLVEEILSQLEVAFTNPEANKGEKKIALLVTRVLQGDGFTYVNVVMDTKDELAKLSNTIARLGHISRLYDISETVRQIKEEGALKGIVTAMKDSMIG